MKKQLIAILAMAVLLSTTVTNGDTGDPVPYQLSLDNIGTIDIISFKWSESRSISSPATPSHSGPIMEKFHIKIQTGENSPKLFLLVATGEHIREAKLTKTYAGLGVMQWRLSDVVVSSYQIEGTGTDIPTDEIDISFRKIEVSFTPMNPDGSPGTPIKAGWDLASNRPISYLSD